jgi:hypothetical protein
MHGKPTHGEVVMDDHGQVIETVVILVDREFNIEHLIMPEPNQERLYVKQEQMEL